jgi:nicotinamide-nucleotide amidase
VIVGGGLGPTHDDVTRQAVAAAAGAELAPHAPSLEHIKALFAARGLEMPSSNERQAAVPRGCDVLRNTTGTAAGFRVAIGSASVFVLPGVPGEFRAMFSDAVLPLLPKGQGVIVMRILRCFGMSESLIAEKLGAELDLSGDPKAAFLPTDGVISVKFTTRAATRDAALARINPVCERARAILREVVFGEGEDTLQDAVAHLLDARGATIAVAESCAGGLVASLLTDVPGISKNFLEGVVTYSNESKTRLLGVPKALIDTVGAVSEEVARLMAQGVRLRSGADLGVGITGIAGPTGGSPDKPVGTVHIAVSSAAGTEHRMLMVPGVRSQVKDRAAKYALNMVRLTLLAGA